MSIYEKIQMLCEGEGFPISSIGQKIAGLSISKASVTGWKKGSMPRADTLKIIADHFGVTVKYLKNEDSFIDTSDFRQELWQYVLKKNNYDEQMAYKAYIAFEKAEAEDMAKDSVNYVQDNHGVIGDNHAPLTIVDATERALNAQETALLEIFRRLDVIKQAQLIAYAASLGE